MVGLIWWLLIGLVAGWLAGQITKKRGFGLAGNLVVGVLGSLVGGVLFRAVGLSATGALGEVIMATLGALVFLFLLGLITSRR